VAGKGGNLNPPSDKKARILRKQRQKEGHKKNQRPEKEGEKNEENKAGKEGDAVKQKKLGVMARGRLHT